MSDEEKMNAIYRTLAETPVPPSVFSTYRDIELEKIMKEHEERAAEFIKRLDRNRRREELIMRVLLIWLPIITVFPIGLLFGFFEWRPVVLAAIVYYALTTFILRTRD